MDPDRCCWMIRMLARTLFLVARKYGRTLWVLPITLIKSSRSQCATVKFPHVSHHSGGIRLPLQPTSISLQIHICRLFRTPWSLFDQSGPSYFPPNPPPFPAYFKPQIHRRVTPWPELGIYAPYPGAANSPFPLFCFCFCLIFHSAPADGFGP